MTNKEILIALLMCGETFRYHQLVDITGYGYLKGLEESGFINRGICDKAIAKADYYVTEKGKQFIKEK